eukprot:sb/3474212/
MGSRRRTFRGNSNRMDAHAQLEAGVATGTCQITWLAGKSGLRGYSIASCLVVERDIIYIGEPTETSKQPIRTRYLGHVTGYQPIRDQYFLIRSVPVQSEPDLVAPRFSDRINFPRYEKLTTLSPEDVTKSGSDCTNLTLT